MAQFYDDFLGQTVGATPTGWTNYTPAATYTFVTTSSGGEKFARLSQAPTVTDLPIMGFNAAGSPSSFEILVRYRTNADPTVGNFALLGYIITANGSYWDAGVYNSPTLNVYWGSYTSGGTVSGGTAQTANTWYWLRYRNDGTNVQVRFWPDTVPEPATWQVNTTSANSRTAGPVGFIGYQGGLSSYNYDIAYIGVGTAGSTAPVNITLGIQDASQSQTSTNSDAATPPAVGAGVGTFGGWGGAIIGLTYYGGGSSTANGLIIQDGYHQQNATPANVTSYADLILANASQAHTAANVVLSAYADLVLANALQAHAATSPTLAAFQDLIIAAASQGHTATSPLVTVLQYLFINDALHGNTAQNILLDQRQSIFIQNALQQMFADEVWVRLVFTPSDEESGRYVPAPNSDGGLLVPSTNDTGRYVHSPNSSGAWQSTNPVDETGVFEAL